jgi:hypothetical protein
LSIRARTISASAILILLNSHAAMSLLRVVGFGGLDGRRGLAISADYVHTFFDVDDLGARSERSAGGRIQILRSLPAAEEFVVLVQAAVPLIDSCDV